MAPNKQKILAAAQKYVRKGNLARAIKEYSRLLEIDPTDVRIRLKVGDLQGKKGDIDDAIQTYRQVAKIHAKSGFLLKAAAVYKRILQLKPKHIATQLRLGEVYHQLGLMSDAMSYFNTASNIAVAEGDIAAYADILRKMIQVDPENIGIRIKLAEHYSKNELVEEAIHEFQRSADMLHSSGRIDDYIKVAERLIYLKPEAFDRIMDLVKVYMDRREHKRALAKLQLCFNNDPEDPVTLGLLAQVFTALGQKDKAVQVLREKARRHSSSGEELEAKEAWEAILKHYPDDAEAVQALGHHDAPFIEEVVPLLDSDILAPLEAPDVAINLPSAEEAYHPPASHVIPAMPRPNEPARPSLNVGVGVGVAPPQMPVQPEYVDVSRLLVETDVFIRYKLFDQACNHLQKIFDVDPENIEAMDRMKQIHVASGNVQQAVDELLNMARVIFQTDYHQGVACLREALRLVPAHPGALDFAVQYGVSQHDLYDHLAEATDYNAAESVENLMAQISEEVGEQRELGAMTLDGDHGFKSDTDMYQLSELTNTDALEGGFEMAGPVDELEIDLDDDYVIADDDDLIQMDMESGDLDDIAIELDDNPAVLPEVSDLAAMLGPNAGDTTAQFDLQHMMEMASQDAAGYQEDDDDDDLFFDEGDGGGFGSGGHAPAYGQRDNPDDPTWVGKMPNEVQEAVSGSYANYPEALRLDLEEVDFYEEQGMVDDAVKTLRQLSQTWNNHPEIARRLDRLGGAAPGHSSGGYASYGAATAGYGGGNSGPPPAYAQPSAATTPAGNITIPDAKILALIPPHEEVSSHFDLGVAYREMKLFDDAIGEFNLSIGEGLQVPHSYQLIAQSLLDLGQFNEAINHLLVSLQHPQAPDVAAYAQYRLGLTYETLGHAQDAVNCFSQISNRPDLFPDIRQRLVGLGAT